MERTVIIIGGGAAGMMAAIYAASAGARVRLLERNLKLGRKIYITGKGRCNVTNMAEPEPFMKACVRNPRFNYAALATLNNVQLMEKLESWGVPLKIERGERVFPVSDHASDITKALEGEMRRLGVTVTLGARVREILADDGRVLGVALESGETYPAEAVIVATGGLSYPSTGSTGDGYDFARALGHEVTPTRPALTSLETNEAWPGELSGLTLKNARLTATLGKKKLYSELGEMLFTHYGISGPLVLTLTSKLPDDFSAVKLTLDLKPALTDEVLDARLLRDLQAQSRRQMASVMDGLAPHNLGLKLLEVAGIPAATPANALTAPQRRALLEAMKRLPLTIKALRGFDEAVITRGGVQVKEINPSTMESKRVAGLYFAGEVIDIDALTGGFNLQLAFSSGALAGKNAAQAAKAGETDGSDDHR